MEFQAKWIRTSEETGGVCPVFRKGWKTEKEVERATLYLTALGVYEAHLNGKRVGNYVLAPGWTAYDKRLQYQEYDITDHSRYCFNSPRCSRKPCSQQIFLRHILFSGNRQGHKKRKTIIKLTITYSRNGKNCCDNRKISCSKTDTPASSCQIQDNSHYNNQDKKLFLLFHQFYILYK